MQLIVKTYLLQVKRKVLINIKKHPMGFISLVLGVFFLGMACLRLLNELLLPVVDVINDTTEINDIIPILGTLSFAVSASVIVVLILQLVISEGKPNSYFKMLQNYGVSQYLRQIFMFGIHTFILIGLGALFLFILLGPSLIQINIYRMKIFWSLVLQLIWFSCFVQASLYLLHIITRFILKRWVGLGFLTFILYLSYQNQTIPNPLNLFGILSLKLNPLWVVVLFLVLLIYIAYVLSFDLEHHKQSSPWVLFSFLPNNLLFKHFKETLRLKDFWFNVILIGLIVALIRRYRPNVFLQPQALKLILLLPCMNGIYAYAQLQDSKQLYVNHKTSIFKVYTVVWLQVGFIYFIQFAYLGIFASGVKNVILSQSCAVLLCLSIFKWLGLLFPLNYKSSQQQQIILAGISLFTIPCVFMVLELQSILQFSTQVLQVIALLSTILINISELMILKGRLYGYPYK